MNDIDQEKSKRARNKFLSLWKKSPDLLKPSLLHLLMENSEFNDWSSDEKLDFLLSELKKNAPSRLNIFDEKFTEKKEIFKKTFLSIFKKRKKVFGASLYYAYVSYNPKDSLNRTSEKLTIIKTILKGFEKIQHPYYTNNIPKIMNELFFKDSPIRRALSAFLQHALKFVSNVIDSTNSPEKIREIYFLVIKIAVQTFNIDLLKEKYSSNLGFFETEWTLKVLKEEYRRCVETILEKGYHLELNADDEKEFRRIFETGKFSEKIDYLLHYVLTDESWLLFMIEIMALNGDFDKCEI